MLCLLYSFLLIDSPLLCSLLMSATSLAVGVKLDRKFCNNYFDMIFCTVYKKIHVSVNLFSVLDLGKATSCQRVVSLILSVDVRIVLILNL